MSFILEAAATAILTLSILIFAAALWVFAKAMHVIVSVLYNLGTIRTEASNTKTAVSEEEDEPGPGLGHTDLTEYTPDDALAAVRAERAGRVVTADENAEYEQDEPTGGTVMYKS